MTYDNNCELMQISQLNKLNLFLLKKNNNKLTREEDRDQKHPQKVIRRNYIILCKTIDDG